jgi:hypothetical protein
MPQNPLRTVAIPPASSSVNIAAITAGQQIKTGPGVFVGVNVNTVGTGAALITLYDGISTAGKKLGTFSALAVDQILANLSFTVGLFAVTAGTTAADVTVDYR